MNGLDLFSGIGGVSIALKPWVRTVAYCERDRYAQGVLLSRMLSNEIDRAPIWDDVTLLRGPMLPKIDIIFGGFPCQDISVAGHGKGLEGERSGLFFEIVRLAKETRTPFIFLENVPAIRTRGLREVVRALTEVGYDCRWTCLSAASVGANHKRERWFLLANANGLRGGNQRKVKVQDHGKVDQRQAKSQYNGIKQSLADSKSIRLETQSHGLSGKQMSITKPGPSGSWEESWWAVEPNVGRVVNGLPNRVDRIKCLGNAVVPIQARTAFMKLIGIEMNAEYVEIAKKRIGA